MSFDGDLYPDNATSVITSKGDIVRGDASGDRERYGIGSTGQILTVASGTVAWAAAGGGVTTNTTTSRLTSSFSTTSSSYTSVTGLELDLSNETGGIAFVQLNCVFSGTGTNENIWHSLYDDASISTMSIGECQGAGGNHTEGSSSLSMATDGSTIAAYTKVENSVDWTGTASGESCNLIASEVY